MSKVAVNRCLLITAMMASSFGSSVLKANEAGNANTNDITAMDGVFENQLALLSGDSMGLDSELWGEMEIPVVLTAARLRQSQLDAPASVTIIEADTIQALGFKDIEEIFRLVPGMLVAYHSGVGEKTASVSYHGTNLPEHRRLQVLIDGRSVYKPGLARVEWADIPLAVEDIARIEVIRGPNSAAYGANSYLGTINIMTKHPQTEKGVTVKVTGGMRDVANTYVNISNSIGATDIRWTLGSKQKSGFDVFEDGVTENRDGIEAVYTTLSTYTPINSQLNMEWQAGYKTGTNGQRELLDNAMVYDSPEDIDADDMFIRTKFNYEFSETQFSHLQVYHQVFDRKIEWSGCIFPGVDIKYSVELVCGDFNKSLSETKSEVEYQHTSQWSQKFRTVAGIRVRLDELDSETYNDGHSDNKNESAFANAEYRLSKSLLLNAGGMYETDSLNGEHFSPRVALNVQLSNSDTVRFIYSEAIRAPDLFEQDGQLVFTIRNARLQNDGPLGTAGTLVDDQVIPFGTKESNVESEKIKSNEISYFGIYPNFNSQLDIKLFYDELTGLISEGLSHDEELTNSNRLVQKGIEGQVKVKLSASDNLAVSFSYVDTKDDFAGNNDDITQESSLSADRSGSLSWIHKYSKNTTLGSAYYHVENWNEDATDGSYTFSRLDMNVRHTMNLTAKYALTLQAALQYRLDDDPLGRDRNNYTDDHFVYGSAQLKF
jgi:iron complex outermembrane receptor protein